MNSQGQPTLAYSSRKFPPPKGSTASTYSATKGDQVFKQVILCGNLFLTTTGTLQQNEIVYSSVPSQLL